MAYVGRTPIVGNFVKLDAITTSATTTFNLLNGGVAYYPQSANNCIVSLNGVIQSPTSAYTISGSTIVFSDALTSSDTIDFILVLGDVLSIGTPSDGTITSAKLATGVAGLISWQSVQTTGFTAVAGRGYPCNTTSAAFTVTLPASATAGDTIILVDYAGTFGTNKVTIAPNGLKINGDTSNVILTTSREAVTITYVDSTQGWVSVSGANEGSKSLDPTTYTVDFLVVAAGGGGGGAGGGGGGAGGYRSSNSTYGNSGGGASAESSLTFNVGTAYTITVGAGGTGSGYSGTSAGSTGNNSSISGTGLTTITSSGGGGGGHGNNGGGTGAATSGGSGGGVGKNVGTSNGGSGTANQGYRGGNMGSPGTSGTGAAGGGGASATGVDLAGSDGGASQISSNGGAGVASTITGSSVTRGGGGGGGGDAPYITTLGLGGSGGGGNGCTNNDNANGSAGTANTGGGGGGAEWGGGTGGTGGSGVVILRMPTTYYSGTTTGSPTVTTSGSDTILTFNASGSYTA